MFKDSAIIAAPNTMKLPIQAVQSTYYGNTTYRTPPPDLPSIAAEGADCLSGYALGHQRLRINHC
jgi:hypothetical protein